MTTGTTPPEAGVGAALFDMDGLLVDSEPLWTVAETELAERYGGTWDDTVKARCIGMALPLAVPTMLAYFGADDADPLEAQAWLQARMVELFRGALPMRPGALRLLDLLGDADVPLALVSSSYRILVDAALDEIGAWRFGTTLAGDEVRRTKPHPEPYLTAAARLGVPTHRCVVFEDSPAGVTAAEAAGCVVVAVPDHAPIEATQSRQVVASLADVELDWLHALVDELRAAG